MGSSYLPPIPPSQVPQPQGKPQKLPHISTQSLGKVFPDTTFLAPSTALRPQPWIQNCSGVVSPHTPMSEVPLPHLPIWVGKHLLSTYKRPYYLLTLALRRQSHSSPGVQETHRLEGGTGASTDLNLRIIICHFLSLFKFCHFPSERCFCFQLSLNILGSSPPQRLSRLSAFPFKCSPPEPSFMDLGSAQTGLVLRRAFCSAVRIL